MSRKANKQCNCEFCRAYRGYQGNYPDEIQRRGISFRNLVILILVILQFGQEKEQRREVNCKPQLIDNSILFIITLYFLTCCIPDC
jgi:hypothetical protein